MMCIYIYNIMYTHRNSQNVHPVGRRDLGFSLSARSPTNKLGFGVGNPENCSLLTVFFQLKMADHATDTTQPMEEILLCSVFRNEMEAVYMCIYVCIHICTERNRKPCWFFEQRDAKFVPVLPGEPQSA